MRTAWQGNWKLFLKERTHDIDKAICSALKALVMPKAALVAWRSYQTRKTNLARTCVKMSKSSCGRKVDLLAARRGRICPVLLLMWGHSSTTWKAKASEVELCSCYVHPSISDGCWNHSKCHPADKKLNQPTWPKSYCSTNLTTFEFFNLYHPWPLATVCIICQLCKCSIKGFRFALPVPCHNKRSILLF